MRHRGMLVAYPATVGALAVAGFVVGSPVLLILAAGLALPASVLAVPAWYLLYGLLGAVPGALPDSSTGSGSGGAGTEAVTSSTGDAATWFIAVTSLAGVALLMAAAVANVVLLRRLGERSRRVTGSTPVHDLPDR